MGGLTVLRALHENLPAEDLIYFGDTARVPYGTKGARTVRAFARQDASFLATRGVKLIVVACNTASAFAMDHLRQNFDIPFLDVIEPGVNNALRETKGGRIGVIGTSGTIRSGRYQEQLMASVSAERIVVQECPLFVPLVEEGMTDHPITHLAVAEYLTPLREQGVDTLILGCTHYPVLKTAIGRFMGSGVTLVDSADALATAATELLANNGQLQETKTKGQLTFYLSDIPWKFAEVGARFLGRPIEGVTTVHLDEAEHEGRLVYQRKDGV